MLDRIRLALRARRYKNRHDPAEIAELRRRVPKGGTAIDIGAHKGAYTYWLRRAVGRRGLVVAVEPQDELVGALSTIYKRDPAVRVRHGAVAPGSGAVTLRIPGAGPSHGASIASPTRPDLREREVRAWSLADLIDEESLGRIDLIKCDCEGAERDIFRAGAAALDRFGPTVLVECERRHGAGDADDPVGELAGIFAELGYEGRCFHAGSLIPIAAFDYDTHQRDPDDKARYGNNFLFTRDQASTNAG